MTRKEKREVILWTKALTDIQLLAEYKRTVFEYCSAIIDSSDLNLCNFEALMELYNIRAYCGRKLQLVEIELIRRGIRLTR